MSVAIETAELISALETASKEAMDVIKATEDVEGEDLASRGHNSVRDAAKDAHNICNNLLKRLGAIAVMPPKPEPAPEPVEQPEPETPIKPNGDAAEAVLEQMEQMEEIQDVLSEAAGEPEANYDEPPTEIADLIDPSLTPKQNLDVLTAKFAAAKNAEEYARSQNDMPKAMDHLRDAERFESGIIWNRAVLAEVV